MPVSSEALKLIVVNRDAAAVNRGFYYQYLKVLHKWLDNYIHDRDVDVFTEVDEDIKEVGGKLQFTQVKCYSSTFNLKSKEVHKALFNFFALYLEKYVNNPDLEFHFVTNTAISRNEQLLKNWLAALPELKGELLSQCNKKVKDIIHGELKRLRAEKLGAKKITEARKALVKSGFQELHNQLDNADLFCNFVKCIRWEFGEMPPEQAVAALNADIVQLLKHARFGGKPFNLLLEVLLSEIYRCSQRDDKTQRLVNNQILTDILIKTTGELDSYVNKSLIGLMDVRFNTIYQAIYDIQVVQQEQFNTMADQQEAIGKLNRSLAGQLKDHQLPKYLTTLPFVAASDVIGRGDCVGEIKSALNAHRCAILQGNGGMGKSTLAKLYANSVQGDYDHLIWLNAEAGLLNSIRTHTTLLEMLKLDLINPESEELKFKQFLDKLGAVIGQNLLVINDLTDVPPYIGQLKELANWQVLITTRLRPAGFFQVPLVDLSFAEARQLYGKFDQEGSVEDGLLRDFFELIAYNPLTIELVAKTVHYSFDLSLQQVIGYFREQKLDDEDLKIDIPGPGQTMARLLLFLQKTFDLSNLDENDRYFMEYFALLPSDETSLADIIDWYGQEYKQTNKVKMTNAINRLHQKGLIVRNGDQLRMHKVFQESILYQVRKGTNAFVGQFFHLAWLTRRLHEGAANDPAQALRFLKYGESILHNIREPFRRGVYQPLLSLENEVLNVYNWMVTPDDMITRWQSLAERAEKYLPDDDSLLAVVSNNYALALAGQQQREKAAGYFNKAVAILKLDEANVLVQLITTLCNLAQLYIEEHDLESFKPVFNDMVAIRNKYKMWEDSSFPLQCNVLGNANQSIKNYPVAIQMYTFAINAHLELPKSERNDIHLVSYLNSIALSYLCNNELPKAENSIIRAVGVLERLQAQDSKAFANVVQTMLLITELTGDEKGSQKLKETLEGILVKKQPN